MTCRSHLRLAVALLACAPAAHANAQTSSGANQRPNILWVVSEDNTYNYVGAYGDPLAHTPNVDRLASSGVVFDHVYTEPVCAPSRSTIITGRYACGMGTQHMRSLQPLPEGVHFFPEYLRAAGYFCTNNGKTDYNTSTTNDRAPLKTGPTAPFNAVSNKGDYAAVWDENGYAAHWRHRRPGQPFFAVFNFMQSHESQLMTRRPLTTDPAKVRVPAYLPDTPEVRADLAQYHDCVTRADAAIGKVLAELEADGLAESTIVFYYSDNGGVVTGPKRFLNDQGTHVAMIVRFPQKFARCAPVPLGTHDRQLVNFADLAPTVLSLAGVPQSPQFQGRAFAGPAKAPAPEFTFTFADRMDERYNLVRSVTDGRYRYVRNYYPSRPWGQHTDYLWHLASIQAWWAHYKQGTLNAAQRQFFEPAAAEALYDCDSDPDNVRNLASDPVQRTRLGQMRSALRKEQLRIRDTGLLPEPMMVQQAAGGSPTQVTGDDRKYPLEKLLDFIDAVQLGDPGQIYIDALIAEAARNELPVGRYWAAVAGFRAKSVSVAEPLLKDADAVVRAAAAETVLSRADSLEAMDAMADAITQVDRPELRLFALDALVRTGRKMPDTLVPVVARLAGSGAVNSFSTYLARLSSWLLREDGPNPVKQKEPAPEQIQTSALE